MLPLSSDRLERLPAISPIVVRLVSLDPYSPKYYEQIVEIAASDPDLAMRVISSANSAASGAIEPVDTIPRAVTRIGSGRVSYLVLTMSMSKILQTSDRIAVGLWHHAIETAVTARALAAHISTVAHIPDRVYAGGLLHDIGRFMLHAEQKAVPLPIETAPDALAEQLAAEAELSGDVNHIEYGAESCRFWRLPPHLKNVIVNHHDYSITSIAKPPDALVATVQIADLFSALLRRRPELAKPDADPVEVEAAINRECVPEPWPALPVAPALLVRLLPEIVEQTDHAMREFGLLVGV